MPIRSKRRTDGALSFSKECRPNNNNNNKMMMVSSDMGAVPDTKKTNKRTKKRKSTSVKNRVSYA